MLICSSVSCCIKYSTYVSGWENGNCKMIKVTFLSAYNFVLQLYLYVQGVRTRGIQKYMFMF